MIIWCAYLVMITAIASYDGHPWPACSTSMTRLMMAACNRCQDVGWVCEKHLDRPHARELPNGCECGRGVRCLDCRPDTVRSVWRIRGTGAAPVFSEATVERNFELAGHSPGPQRRSDLRKGFGGSSEPVRRQPKREAAPVRAQLRRC
jgi:hypothetical protein